MLLSRRLLQPSDTCSKAGSQSCLTLPWPTRTQQHAVWRKPPLNFKSVSQCKGAQSFARAPCRVHARSGDEIQRVQDVELPVPTAEDLEHDRAWLTAQIRTWLDEEWTPLEIHQRLGEAAAEAYVQARKAGEHEMTGILLSVSQQLLAFNFFDTFVDAFQVGNKVSEVLMLRLGCDVCCSSMDDKERYQRVNQQMSNTGHS